MCDYGMARGEPSDAEAVNGSAFCRWPGEEQEVDVPIDVRRGAAVLKLGAAPGSACRGMTPAPRSAIPGRVDQGVVGQNLTTAEIQPLHLEVTLVVVDEIETVRSGSRCAPK